MRHSAVTNQHTNTVNLRVDPTNVATQQQQKKLKFIIDRRSHGMSFPERGNTYEHPKKKTIITITINKYRDRWSKCARYNTELHLFAEQSTNKPIACYADWWHSNKCYHREYTFVVQPHLMKWCCVTRVTKPSLWKMRIVDSHIHSHAIPNANVRTSQAKSWRRTCTESAYLKIVIGTSRISIPRNSDRYYHIAMFPGRSFVEENNNNYARKNSHYCTKSSSPGNSSNRVILEW